MGALAAGGAAGLGTGAFSAMTADRDAHINVVADADGLIALTPGHEYTRRGPPNDVPPREDLPDAEGEGPPSFSGSGTVSEDYVFMENGELVIDLTGGDGVKGDGVNPNSTYQWGAIGDDGGDAIDDFVAGRYEDPPDVTKENVLYGKAAGGDKTAIEDPAFVVTNQDSTEHNVELFYNGDLVSGATALLVGENGSRGATTFKVDNTEDTEAGRMGAFPLEPGESLYISILVVTTSDVDIEDSFDGDITIRAGGDVEA